MNRTVHEKQIAADRTNRGSRRGKRALPVETRRTLFDAQPGGGVCRCLNDASSVVCADCTSPPQLSEPELVTQIDEQRLRLGMSVSMPVRIGTRDGRMWAALSRHVDSIFREGDHAGANVAEALASLLDKLRRCERFPCACGKTQGCDRCAGVGSYVAEEPGR